MTENVWFFISRQKYFNSHPHEEDDGLTLFIKSFNDISTHILTKRMTLCGFYILHHRYISTHILTKRMTSSWHGTFTPKAFQLTSSRRGWLLFSYFYTWTWIFQLTSSRRGWQVCIVLLSLPGHFNSHPHEEDDSVSRFLNPSLYISTHILTKRMTTQPILSSTRY